VFCGGSRGVGVGVGGGGVSELLVDVEKKFAD